MGIDFNLPPSDDSSIDFNLPVQSPYEQPADDAPKNIIKVIGVGGGGGNAVRNMFEKGIFGVDFYVCNTDAQVLASSPIPYKLQLGEGLTHGLGCGAKPEVGRDAALESMQDIEAILTPETRMVFITAGMGGGTGTGAAPVIAEMAKSRGILTVGIVTTPFSHEGAKRRRVAEQGVAELERCVDTLVVINNANLLQICPRGAKYTEAFRKADEVLCNAAKGIAELITKEGYINLDFADVQTIMKDGGTALMGMATSRGEQRAKAAIEEALSSPLLDDIDITGATGVLVNIAASEDTLEMEEVDEIGKYLQDAVGVNAEIIAGQVLTDEAGDSLTVTVIVTGFSQKRKLSSEIVRVADKVNTRPVLGVEQPQTETFRLQDAETPPAREQRTPRDAARETRDTRDTRESREVRESRDTREQPANTRKSAPRQSSRPASEHITRGEQYDLFSQPTQPDAHEERYYEQPAAHESEPQERSRPQPQIPTYTDWQNPDFIDRLHKPAFLRRNVDIDADTPTNNGAKHSRLSVQGDSEEGYQLRNNSFLYDNVD